MLVILDHQHTGKPGRWKDCGAVNGTAKEVELVDRYIHWAKKYLESYGIDVCVISDGSYSDRHSRANVYANAEPGKAAYIACHVNAGGGDDAICFYDYRSQTGKPLGVEIVKQLKNLEGIDQGKVIKCHSENWTKNAYYTIRSVGRATSICFEPFFIDNPDHAPYLTEQGLKKIGKALADGIKSYWSV